MAEWACGYFCRNAKINIKTVTEKLSDLIILQKKCSWPYVLSLMI